MNTFRTMSAVIVAVLLAIGCGSGKPQDASATDTHGQPEQPTRLAEMPANASSTATAGRASIHGTVHFTGTAPTPEKVKMDADPICQQQHATPVYMEDAVVSNSMLKNVFVYVKDGAKGPFPSPTTPVVLAQAGCWYNPHIFGIQVDQPLEIVNNDATLHNINAKPTINQPFNVAQPVKGMKMTKKFAKPEIMVKFKCNVHPWMNAYVGVVDNPFFSVSGADGSFTITGLPAGTYTLEAWHEKYGTQTQTVTVADGETKTVDLTFTAK